MLALAPLAFFVIVYLVTSIVAGDFYKVPISVAFMLTAIVAVATSKGTLRNRIAILGRGAGKPNMILMVWIFILAGAFANSAKEMGSVEDMVYLTLGFVPANMILSGIFISSALISLSIGTSVGTIVAVMPIATGIASAIGTPAPFLTAIVVGGAFFGDNLSFISDTTIVATQSQGCRMSDKFRTNLFIALPAAIIIAVVYAVMGAGLHSPEALPEVHFLKILPYMAVLVTAILGLDVLLVLCIGIGLTGLVGICIGSYDIYSWFGAMGKGVEGMGELIIITLLAGGILETIRANGGIRFLMTSILRHVHSPRTAELSIAVMVSLVNVCTANNTVAIITVAGIAKDISQRFGLSPRRVASILDTFSCTMQGVLPYGAQVLMASALSSVNPIDIIPHLYYPFALGVFALLAILFSHRGETKRTVMQ